MPEHPNKCLESVAFRFKSIFLFQNLSFFATLSKVILLIIFGLPFVVFELLSLILAIFTCIPVVGIILNFTVCLIFDLLSSGLFWLIMLPNKIQAEKTIQSVTQKKLVHRVKLSENEYQNVYNAITWCIGNVNENIDEVLDRYKDKLFLGTLSGFDGLHLQKILNNIMDTSNDTGLAFVLDRAISILEEHIYK